MQENLKVSHLDLKNSFRIIQAEDKTYPLVNLQLFVKVGSCWEADDEAGYSHLMEHLVFKSTKKYPKNTIMEKASILGAAINAFTEFDSTCFYLTLPAENIKDGMEILSELVKSANFSDNDFISERNVVIEELKQYRNDKEDYFLEQIPALYFKQNPYRKTIIGTEESLHQSTADRMRIFYKKYYQPDNCFLCITGDYDESEVKKYSKQYFGKWDNTTKLIKKELFTELPENKPYYYINQKAGRNFLAFVLPELSDNHPDSYPLSLVGKAFAVGKNSRLYHRLYIKEKLIDSLKVHSLSGLFDGLTIILIHPRKNADLYRITEVFLQELKSLYLNSLSMDELEQHKREMIHSSRYTFEYIESLGLSLCTEELLGDYKNFLKYEKQIENINSEDIKRVIRELYSYQRLSIITSGKKELDPSLIEKLVNDNHASIKLKKRNEKTYEHVLPNGIKLFLKKVEGKAICGVSLALKSSQLLEKPSELGLNQLSSSVMLYGNKKRDYDHFLTYCTNHGVQFGISCSKDNTKIKFKCFKDNLIESLDLIRDVLHEPTFPKDHFQNLKKSFISTIHRMYDYPQTMALYKWKQMLFGEHSNLISKDGQVESLRNVKLDNVYNWYKNNIIDTEAVLCIIGDIDFEETLYACERIFNFGSYNSRKVDFNIILDKPTEKFKLIDNDFDQSIINIGGFSCNSFETEKKTALLILSQIIGGEINSRLFNELREKKGLAYSTEFDFDTVDKIGYFDIFSIVDVKRENEAINSIKHILQDIKHKGVKDREFDIAKKFIKGQSRIDEESVLIQAQLLSGLFLLGRSYEYYLDKEKRLMSVEKDLLKTIANEYFNDDDLFTLIYR